MIEETIEAMQRSSHEEPTSGASTKLSDKSKRFSPFSVDSLLSKKQATTRTKYLHSYQKEETPNVPYSLPIAENQSDEEHNEPETEVKEELDEDEHDEEEHFQKQQQQKLQQQQHQQSLHDEDEDVHIEEDEEDVDEDEDDVGEGGGDSSVGSGADASQSFDPESTLEKLSHPIPVHPRFPLGLPLAPMSIWSRLSNSSFTGITPSRAAVTAASTPPFTWLSAHQFRAPSNSTLFAGSKLTRTKFNLTFSPFFP